MPPAARTGPLGGWPSEAVTAAGTERRRGAASCS